MAENEPGHGFSQFDPPGDAQNWSAPPADDQEEHQAPAYLNQETPLKDVQQFWNKQKNTDTMDYHGHLEEVRQKRQSLMDLRNQADSPPSSDTDQTSSESRPQSHQQESQSRSQSSNSESSRSDSPVTYDKSGRPEFHQYDRDRPSESYSDPQREELQRNINQQLQNTNEPPKNYDRQSSDYDKPRDQSQRSERSNSVSPPPPVEQIVKPVKAHSQPLAQENNWLPASTTSFAEVDNPEELEVQLQHVLDSSLNNLTWATKTLHKYRSLRHSKEQLATLSSISLQEDAILSRSRSRHFENSHSQPYQPSQMPYNLNMSYGNNQSSAQRAVSPDYGYGYQAQATTPLWLHSGSNHVPTQSIPHSTVANSGTTSRPLSSSTCGSQTTLSMQQLREIYGTSEPASLVAKRSGRLTPDPLMLAAKNSLSFWSDSGSSVKSSSTYETALSLSSHEDSSVVRANEMRARAALRMPSHDSVPAIELSAQDRAHLHAQAKVSYLKLDDFYVSEDNPDAGDVTPMRTRSPAPDYPTPSASPTHNHMTEPGRDLEDVHLASRNSLIFWDGADARSTDGQDGPGSGRSRKPSTESKSSKHEWLRQAMPVGQMGSSHHIAHASSKAQMSSARYDDSFTSLPSPRSFATIAPVTSEGPFGEISSRSHTNLQRRPVAETSSSSFSTDGKPQREKLIRFFWDQSVSPLGTISRLSQSAIDSKLELLEIAIRSMLGYENTVGARLQASDLSPETLSPAFMNDKSHLQQVWPRHQAPDLQNTKLLMIIPSSLISEIEAEKLQATLSQFESIMEMSQKDMCILSAINNKN